MDINLADAFSAIAYVDRLVNTGNGRDNILVTNEQEAIDKVVNHINGLKKKYRSKRASKAPIKGAGFNFQDVHVNASDLLNGVRLELYDLWRVFIKAHEAFEDMVAANRKTPLSEIKQQIGVLTRRAVVDTWRHGYSDEPFAIWPVVPIRHDGLDLEFKDLEIGGLLDEAYKWGCGLNNMRILADKAWEEAVGMVKHERATVGQQTPERAEQSRRVIVDVIQGLVRRKIAAEKRSRRKQGQKSPQQESPTTPAFSSAQWSTEAVGSRTPGLSSAKWSTEAQASETPRTPFSPWTPLAIPHESTSSDSTSSSEGSNKRKRPSPLPTPRKRKASDTSFRPGPPTPSNPDEVSPRIPKMPRRSNDPLYRPGSALQDPTTPPVTPKLSKLSKRSSNQKAADRAAKKIEKKLKKKQADKAEKKAKNVSFDAQSSISSASSKTLSAQSSKSPSPSKPSSAASSKTSSPQVVITKKASKKSPTPSPSTGSKSSKSSKNSVKGVANKSGIKKTATKTKKSENVALAARPKRQAAIEAEKSFGKTRVIE
jgi:hypothetical protein